MGLIRRSMYAEGYLEPSRTPTMGHLCENRKKALL